jgi:hypothetical protein
MRFVRPVTYVSASGRFTYRDTLTSSVDDAGRVGDPEEVAARVRRREGELLPRPG